MLIQWLSEYSDQNDYNNKYIKPFIWAVSPNFDYPTIFFYQTVPYRLNELCQRDIRLKSSKNRRASRTIRKKIFFSRTSYCNYLTLSLTLPTVSISPLVTRRHIVCAAYIDKFVENLVLKISQFCFLGIVRLCIGFNFRKSEVWKLQGALGASLKRGKTSKKIRKSKIFLWGL
jgi:hypothetical protein